MIANIRCPATPSGFAPPLGPASGSAVFGSIATALLAARRLLGALTGGPQRQEPPEPPSNGGGLWDDPALWMLMIH